MFQELRGQLNLRENKYNFLRKFLRNFWTARSHPALGKLFSIFFVNLILILNMFNIAFVKYAFKFVFVTLKKREINADVLSPAGKKIYVKK